MKTVCYQMSDSAWNPNNWVPAVSLGACIVIIVAFMIYISFDKGGY